MRLAGYNVRSASKEDIATCNSLCRTVHGHDRAGELEDAVREKTATVVERLGRVTGYATSIGFFSHAVSETNEDMMALIGAAESITRPGILVPTRNHALFSWCLKNDLQLNQQMTLMSNGTCAPGMSAFAGKADITPAAMAASDTIPIVMVEIDYDLPIERPTSTHY